MIKAEPATSKLATIAQLPAVASFECSTCGAIHHAPSGMAFGLPVGWSAQSSTAWCGSCTAAGVPAREMAASRKRTRRVA